MRKISLVVVAAMLLSVGSLSANHNPKKVGPTKSLAGQIADLLDDNPLVVGKSDLIATVRFTLNSEKEIVVLSVTTDNENLEGFVKSRLNYKKVDLNNFQEGRYYTLPVRVTES